MRMMIVAPRHGRVRPCTCGWASAAFEGHLEAAVSEAATAVRRGGRFPAPPFSSMTRDPDIVQPCMKARGLKIPDWRRTWAGELVSLSTLVAVMNTNTMTHRGTRISRGMRNWAA